MNIGKFASNAQGGYTGKIATIGAVFDHVVFEPVRSKGNGPDFILTTDCGELGAAWKKTSDKGKTYLSVSLKGPFVPAPIYAALLESEKDKGSFSLVWNEPKRSDA